MRISFIIGMGMDILPLLKKVLEEKSKTYKFDYLVTTTQGLEKYANTIADSDAIIMYTHELPNSVEDKIKNSGAKVVISLLEDYVHLNRCSLQLYAEATKYFKVNGEENLKNLIHLILRELGYKVDVGSIEEVPWHGIYHPKLGAFKSTKDYLQRYGSKGPMVGILFHRNYWLYGTTKYIDDLIEDLESEGLGVLPVFTHGYRDDIFKTPSKEDTIREFFIVDGKPVIDVLINLTTFFLLDHGAWWKKKGSFTEVEGVELLMKLNVPVITPILDFFKSVNEWLSDQWGISYMTQVYSVIMPEVDGAIEPIFISGTRTNEDGTRVHETFKPHTKYIARRVKKWIELRQKPPKERKIAIVLINPPCRGLEANVAVGWGLDVPESVVRLLHKLHELGYDVGDPLKLPRNGKELIRMIMERKAISEFRWTPIEEIVKRGGALDFVDENTYLEWFNELPEDVKNKMIKDWAHPSDVLHGRAYKALVGMVYNGKFAIPGIRFGNIVIMPQPKAGCAGSACDGRACRVLHDPTITPPHQWLSVYRWVSRVFKANMIIHFGTHGYLEWRHGKGVGLSPSDWPEISIDDLPHLYVYIVSNPMEGVVAKRRSYAKIVDHIYPPMDVADVLDDLEDLVDEYWKAKQSGEFVRAEIVYKDILEKAKKNHIRVKEGDPDEVVREVHRYLDMVRGTQIDMGLHIFGHPPEDPSKLATYAVTVMTYDSYNYPSIVRVIAEFMGLNYDRMRSNPSEVNELGLTNSETLELIRKVTIKALERILRNPELKANIVDVVKQELESNFSLKGEVYASA